MLYPVELRARCTDQVPEADFDQEPSTAFPGQNSLTKFAPETHRTGIVLLLKTTSYPRRHLTVFRSIVVLLCRQNGSCLVLSVQASSTVPPPLDRLNEHDDRERVSISSKLNLLIHGL